MSILSWLSVLAFGLCVAGYDDHCDLLFADVASRTVLADVVFRRRPRGPTNSWTDDLVDRSPGGADADVVFSGQCLAVSHANSSMSLGGRLDFSTDDVTITFFVNRTLKGVYYSTLLLYLLTYLLRVK